MFVHINIPVEAAPMLQLFRVGYFLPTLPSMRTMS